MTHFHLKTDEITYSYNIPAIFPFHSHSNKLIISREKLECADRDVENNFLEYLQLQIFCGVDCSNADRS